MKASPWFTLFTKNSWIIIGVDDTIALGEKSYVSLGWDLNFLDESFHPWAFTGWGGPWWGAIAARRGLRPGVNGWIRSSWSLGSSDRWKGVFFPVYFRMMVIHLEAVHYIHYIYIYIYEYASYYILSIDNVYMQNMYNSHLWPRSPFSGSNPTANRKRSVEQQLWKGLDRRKLEIHQTLTQLTGSFLIFETWSLWISMRSAWLYIDPVRRHLVSEAPRP